MSLAAVLFATAGVSSPPSRAERPPRIDAAIADTAGTRSETVTLVTGDRVTLREAGGTVTPDIRPAEGREGIRFVAQRHGDSFYVLPQDTLALVRTGRLDRRLFDVSSLLADGFGDTRHDLPLIVQDDSDATSARVSRARMEVAGASTRSLPAARAIGVRQPKAKATALWTSLTTGQAEPALAAGIGRVWLDGVRQLSLDVSVPQIGAPTAWDAGYTGAGVTVAVLDSGIDATHPDLAGRVAEARNFTWDPDGDQVGHGTHVAATIAGSGSASGGRNQGVAPDARLLDGKVCEEHGCFESDIIAGMQWAAESGAQVVNLSLGAVDEEGIDPLEAAVQSLSQQHGTLFVVSAGNDGPGPRTVNSPASADAALAVAAVDDADQVADFSSRGPRVGDSASKPDISAPGVAIVAAKARDGVIGDPVGEHYVSLSGTSMATPHVAGAAALLAQHHPDWDGAKLKSHLMGSVKAPAPDALAEGAGRVDVARAISQVVDAAPTSVSFPLQRWPHDDDQPVQETVTYRNDGASPVTLDLAVTANDPQGHPAPAGMFTLSPSSVLVPAGGEAVVRVTADTRVDGLDGVYSGHVVASAGDAGTRVVTPIAVEREIESYDLTLLGHDQSGETPDELSVTLVGLDQPLYMEVTGPNDRRSLRLTKGRYHLNAFVIRAAAPGNPSQLALLTQPLVDLSADTTIDLDARLAKPFTLTFERDDVQMAAGMVTYDRATPYGPVSAEVDSGGSFEGLSSAHLGPAVPRDELQSAVMSSWAVPDATGGLADSDRVYTLAWFGFGRLLTGLTRDIEDDQLARLRVTMRANGPDLVGSLVRTPHPVGGEPLYSGSLPVTLPKRRTELVNTDGVDWSSRLWVERVDPNDPGSWPITEQILCAPTRSYTAGRAYDESWGAAVHGPAFPSATAVRYPGPCFQSAERAGDTVGVHIPLFSDAAGHAGYSLDPGDTRLFRDGELVGESIIPGVGEFTVPASPSTYRLEVRSDREPALGLSTSLRAAWTFRSAHVDGDQPVDLPLMAVRFAPPLDRFNRAPVGTVIMPITIDRFGPVGTVGKPSIQVSYDDGATWRDVRVQRITGDSYLAAVTHPADTQFVSLRATARSDRGNTVEQTIIRAYGLR